MPEGIRLSTWQLARGGVLAPQQVSSCPELIVAGQNGALLLDACTGETLKNYRRETDPAINYYDALALPVPEGETGDPALLMTGESGFLVGLDAVGNAFEFGRFMFGPMLDAAYIADDPSKGAFYTAGSSELNLLKWQTSSWEHETFALGIPALSAVSNASGTKFLIINATSLNFVDATSATPTVTEIAPLTSNPRRIRCDLATNLCAISDFANSKLSLVKWDGETAPSLTDTIDVALGPVGIDIFGNTIVSAGYTDNKFSVTTVNTEAKASNINTLDLPTGCLAPGHILFLRDSNNSLVVSCNGSNGFAYLTKVF